MSEPKNEITEEVIDEPTKEVSTRRGFLRKWGPKLGIGAAALVALKEVKGAQAACGTAYKYVPSSPCQSYRYICDVSCMTGAYYNCRNPVLISHNNCAYYGYGSGCCGN